MYKKLLHLILLLPILLVTACSNNNDIPSRNPEDQPTEPVDTISGNRLTVLVYMVSTNNLGTSGFDRLDLDEMQTAAAAGDIVGGRLLVYHATNRGVMLKEITAAGVDTLKVYDQSVASVSRQRMTEVIDDVQTYAPAPDYGMVIWGHGTGWLEDGLAESTGSVSTYSFGSDGLSKAKNMNVSTFAEILQGRGFSFVYFDCCYMATVEVAYQMRNAVDYIIASPTEVPVNGMPYDQVLRHFYTFYTEVETSMLMAARTTFLHYNNTFNIGDCPCSMTLIRTNRMDDLAEATRRVYGAATRLYDADYSYQRYQVSSRCYYFDLEDYISSICPDDDMFHAWQDALYSAVIYKAATPWIWSAIPIERCCGLSTYIMTSQQSSSTKNYKDTAWYKDVASYLL